MSRRAVVLFVDGEVEATVDAIRERWDPAMAARIAAHLTIVHDVVDHARADELVDELAAATAPFTYRLTRTATWSKIENGIYLDVDDPTGGLAGLYDALIEMERPGWSRIDFRPHVTLVHGRTAPAGAADAAWPELEALDAGWECAATELAIVESHPTAWVTVRAQALSG